MKSLFVRNQFLDVCRHCGSEILAFETVSQGTHITYRCNAVELIKPNGGIRTARACCEFYASRLDRLSFTPAASTLRDLYREQIRAIRLVFGSSPINLDVWLIDSRIHVKRISGSCIRQTADALSVQKYHPLDSLHDTVTHLLGWASVERRRGDIAAARNWARLATACRRDWKGGAA